MRTWTTRKLPRFCQQCLLKQADVHSEYAVVSGCWLQRWTERYHHSCVEQGMASSAEYSGSADVPAQQAAGSRHGRLVSW